MRGVGWEGGYKVNVLPGINVIRLHYSFVIILSDYWYVVLVVVVGVVVIAVFLCACIVWNKKRYGQHHMRQLHLRRYWFYVYSVL